MPRRCSICHHEHLEKINQALVQGAALSEIAALYRVSDDALGRHKVNHLPTALAKAQEAKEVLRADDLLGQVRNLQARTLAILEGAEASGELRTALAAISQGRANVELLARLLGELDERPQVNISMNSEWIELRAVIVTALAPHEAAKHDVLKALEGAAGNGRA